MLAKQATSNTIELIVLRIKNQVRSICKMLFAVSIIALFHVFIVVAQTAIPLPVGGRFDVHGWLILPQEQPQYNNNTSYTVRAWFSVRVRKG